MLVVAAYSLVIFVDTWIFLYLSFLLICVSLVCLLLQEFLKRLQDRHVECAQTVAKKATADAQAAAAVSPDAPNVLQALMHLEQDNTRAKSSKKVTLETEKDKNADEKAVEELKRQL